MPALHPSRRAMDSRPTRADPVRRTAPDASTTWRIWRNCPPRSSAPPVDALDGRSGLPERWLSGLTRRTGASDHGRVFELVEQGFDCFVPFVHGTPPARPPAP
jgi:hypothetical protein